MGTLRQIFATSALLTDNCHGRAAVLCAVGCFAASLLPVLTRCQWQSPPLVRQPKMSPAIAKCPPVGNITSDGVSVLWREEPKNGEQELNGKMYLRNKRGRQGSAAGGTKSHNQSRSSALGYSLRKHPLPVHLPPTLTACRASEKWKPNPEHLQRRRGKL